MTLSSLKTKLQSIILLLFFCGLVWASSTRTAIVIETKGENWVQSNGTKAHMRTLQVLPLGAIVTVAEDATLRLSYFKSGTKETITGPCTVEIQDLNSSKISEEGKVESKSSRGNSTGLPGSENLRRTGGALQAVRFDSSPEDELARMDFEEMICSPAGTTRSYKARFTNRQRTYLDPANARRVTWTETPNTVNLRLLEDDEEIANLDVEGRETRLPQLARGKSYTLELTGWKAYAEIDFSILTSEQSQAVLEAEESIRMEEPAESRPLYVRLLRLQSEIGLYRQAEETADAALQAFPDDPGFLFMLALLKEELGKREQAKELLNQAKQLEAKLYQ
jgi:hypothetical protein